MEKKYIDLSDYNEPIYKIEYYCVTAEWHLYAYRDAPKNLEFGLRELIHCSSHLSEMVHFCSMSDIKKFIIIFP